MTMSEDNSDNSRSSIIINERTLKDMFGDDDEMFKEILTGFVAPSEEIVEEMRAAIAEESTEGVKLAAHKLKSAASSVGADSLADMCKTLEMAEIEGRFSEAEVLIDDLAALMDKIKKYVEAL